MSSKNKSNKKIKWPAITWAILAIISILFVVMVFNFTLLPMNYKLPVILVVVAIALVMAIFSLRKHKGKGKIFTTVINVILSIVLIIGSVLLPVVQANIKGIFSSVTTTKVDINVYAFTEEYKNAHADIFVDTTTSENIEDYINSTFITQSTADQENQTFALEKLSEIFGGNVLTNEQEDIFAAVTAFYAGEGDALILSSVYEQTITEIPGFESFLTDTIIVHTITKEIEVEDDTEDVNLSENAFQIMIAGSDTRSSELSTYGRTDVDIMMTVNPDTKQILMVSIPRDYYIPNPALGYGYDKLTHLGNHGIENTMLGLSNYFDINLTEYAVVNFTSFQDIVNAIGGIDVNNPYYFTTAGGNGSLDGTVYEFAEGWIHLDGASALAYCRERYNLSNGDYGRSEHQAIVLGAIIDKMTSAEIIANAGNVLAALQGKVLTSVSADSILSLASTTLSSGDSWNLVTYNLGGTGTMNGTASMGWNTMLYTVVPFASQVSFINEQVNKVMNGETIVKEEIPSSDETTYIPN